MRGAYSLFLFSVSLLLCALCVSAFGPLFRVRRLSRPGLGGASVFSVICLLFLSEAPWKKFSASADSSSPLAIPNPSPPRTPPLSAFPPLPQTLPSPRLPPLSRQHPIFARPRIAAPSPRDGHLPRRQSRTHPRPPPPPRNRSHPRPQNLPQRPFRPPPRPRRQPHRTLATRRPRHVTSPLPATGCRTLRL